MAFQIENFRQVDVVSTNQDLNLRPGNLNTPQLFVYISSGDNMAAITANNYFADVANVLVANLPFYNIRVGDLIYVKASDDNAWVEVTALSPNVTTAIYNNLADGSIYNVDVNAAAAIAFSKMEAMATGEVLFGNAGVPTVGALTGDASISNAGALTIDLNFERTATITLSSANVLAMYATPVQIIAAGGANTAHLVSRVVYEVDYGGTQFANGGAFGLQYGNTANLGGKAASATTAAAVLNGYTADSMVSAAGALATGASSAVVNQGIFISNDTAAFITGDSTVYVHVTYSTVTTVV